MKRLLQLSLLLTIGVAIGLAGGCSNDDGPTGGGTPPGDTTAPEFQFVDSVMGEGSFDMLGKSLELSFQLLDSIPGAKVAGRKPPRLSASVAVEDGCEYWRNLSFSYVYDATSGWHVFDFSGELIDSCEGDTVDLSGIDSIRVTSGGTPMPIPDATADALSIRNSIDGKRRSSTDSVSATQSFDITGNALADSAIAIINGTASEDVHMVVSDPDATCDLTLSNSTVITAVRFVAAADDCPQSGTVTITSSVNLACQGQGNSPLDSLNVNGAWTITVRFNNGMQTMTYSDGTTTWTVTEECGGSPGGGGGFGDDSSFVSDFFGGEDLMGNMFKSFDVSFALLEDTVITAGASRLPDVGYAAGGGMDTIIVGNYTYTYSGGWHIFDFSAMVINQWPMDSMQFDTTDLYGWDSVQTLVNGQPVQYPAMDSLSGLSVLAHVYWSGRNTADSGVIHHAVWATVNSTNPPDTIVTFNGMADDTIWVSDGWMEGECEVFAAVSQSITDLTMNVSDTLNDCPLSGTMSVTATIDALCTSMGQQGTDSLSINGTWNVDATVNANNTITVTFNDGTTSWTATEPCMGGTGAGVSDHSPWMSFRD